MWNLNFPLDNAFPNISPSSSSFGVYYSIIILFCTKSHKWWPIINVLGLVMKYWILREANTTMIITINKFHIHLLVENTHKYFPHSYGLTWCLNCSDVFSLCWAKFHRPLFLSILRNSCRPNIERSTWNTFTIWWTPYLICIIESIELHSLHPLGPQTILGCAFAVPQHTLCFLPIQLGRIHHRLT